MQVKNVVGMDGTQKTVVSSYAGMKSSKELTFTLTAAEAITNCMILPSAEDVFTRAGSSPTWQTNVTFACSKLLAEKGSAAAALNAFYALIAQTNFSVKGFKIRTAETGGATTNLDGDLVFQRTQVDGDVKKVTVGLFDYKENVGNGYSNKIQLPYNFVKDTKLRAYLSSLADGSVLSVTIMYDGVADSHDFIEIGSQSL